MAFIFPSHESLIRRYSALPETLRDAVDSAQVKKTMESIGREHYLDNEKEQTLEALVGFVFLGFLAKSELVHEVSERLFLNHEHSRAIANDINNRILDSVKEEIDEIYNPNEEAEEEPKEEEPEPLKASIIAPEEEGERIRVSATEAESVAPISLPISEGGGPVVLQKGGSFFEKSETKEVKKRPFASFNMFASSAEQTPTPTVKVKVETPQAFSWPFEKKKAPEKVVHYTESRSVPESALGGAEGLIHLDALQTAAKEPTPKMPIQTAVEPAKEPVVRMIKPEFSKLEAPAPNVATPEKLIPVNIKPVVEAVQKSGSAPTAPKPLEGTQSIPPQNAEPALEGNVVHLK